MPNDNGFVKIHRKLWKDWKGTKLEWAGAWLWLISHAEWREGELLKPGQLLTTTAKLAEAWGWSESKVNRFLRRCEKDGDINRAKNAPKDARKAGGKGARGRWGETLITLNNYEEYQSTQRVNRDGKGDGKGEGKSDCKGSKKTAKTTAPTADENGPLSIINVLRKKEYKNMSSDESDTGTEKIGTQAKELLDYFCTAWERQWGTKYIVSAQKEMAFLKRLLKAVDKDELKERIDRYLEDREPFVWDKRHPLMLFQPNKYAGVHRTRSKTKMTRKDFAGKQF